MQDPKEIAYNLVEKHWWYSTDRQGFIDEIAQALLDFGAAALRQERTKKERVADVTCPQCGGEFRLDWTGDFRPLTLILRGCPSGGIYDVSIHCPHCNYKEEL